MTATENAGGKQGRGRFKPGQSGNPAGKPKGARNQLTELAEKLLADDAQAVAQTVISAAKGGDMTAARLILDRILPVRKGRPVNFELGTIATADDVTRAIGAVLAAMSQGDLTPDEAATVAGVLDQKRKAIETVELEKRLATIEAQLGDKR